MKLVLVAFGCGGVFGAVFGKLNLPAPVPTTLAGLAGIVGLFVGYWMVTK